MNSNSKIFQPQKSKKNEKKTDGKISMIFSLYYKNIAFQDYFKRAFIVGLFGCCFLFVSIGLNYSNQEILSNYNFSLINYGTIAGACFYILFVCIGFVVVFGRPLNIFLSGLFFSDTFKTFFISIFHLFQKKVNNESSENFYSIFGKRSAFANNLNERYKQIGSSVFARIFLEILCFLTIEVGFICCQLTVAAFSCGYPLNQLVTAMQSSMLVILYFTLMGKLRSLFVFVLYFSSFLLLPAMNPKCFLFQDSPSGLGTSSIIINSSFFFLDRYYWTRIIFNEIFQAFFLFVLCFVVNIFFEKQKSKYYQSLCSTERSIAKVMKAKAITNKILRHIVPKSLIPLTKRVLHVGRKLGKQSGLHKNNSSTTLDSQCSSVPSVTTVFESSTGAEENFDDEEDEINNEIEEKEDEEMKDMNEKQEELAMRKSQSSNSFGNIEDTKHYFDKCQDFFSKKSIFPKSPFIRSYNFVVVCNIRMNNFSSLCSEISPLDLSTVLNTYLSIFREILEKNNRAQRLKVIEEPTYSFFLEPSDNENKSSLCTEAVNLCISLMNALHQKRNFNINGKILVKSSFGCGICGDKALAMFFGKKLFGFDFLGRAVGISEFLGEKAGNWEILVYKKVVDYIKNKENDRDNSFHESNNNHNSTNIHFNNKNSSESFEASYISDFLHIATEEVIQICQDSVNNDINYTVKTPSDSNYQCSFQINNNEFFEIDIQKKKYENKLLMIKKTINSLSRFEKIVGIHSPEIIKKKKFGNFNNNNNRSHNNLKRNNSSAYFYDSGSSVFQYNNSSKTGIMKCFFNFKSCFVVGMSNEREYFFNERGKFDFLLLGCLFLSILYNTMIILDPQTIIISFIQQSFHFLRSDLNKTSILIIIFSSLSLYFEIFLIICYFFLNFLNLNKYHQNQNHLNHNSNHYINNTCFYDTIFRLRYILSLIIHFACLSLYALISLLYFSSVPGSSLTHFLFSMEYCLVHMSEIVFNPILSVLIFLIYYPFSFVFSTKPSHKAMVGVMMLVVIITKYRHQYSKIKTLKLQNYLSVYSHLLSNKKNLLNYLVQSFLPNKKYVSLFNNNKLSNDIYFVKNNYGCVLMIKLSYFHYFVTKSDEGNEFFANVLHSLLSDFDSIIIKNNFQNNSFHRIKIKCDQLLYFSKKKIKKDSKIIETNFITDLFLFALQLKEAVKVKLKEISDVLKNDQYSLKSSSKTYFDILQKTMCGFVATMHSGRFSTAMIGKSWKSVEIYGEALKACKFMLNLKPFNENETSQGSILVSSSVRNVVEECQIENYNFSKIGIWENNIDCFQLSDEKCNNINQF